MQAHRVVPLLLAAACADTTGPDGTRPVVVSASVARDSGNVLAAAVPVRARYADSVAVRFRRAGDAIGQTTPAVAVHGDSARIAVYGLYASNRHAIEVLAWGPGGEAEVFALEHTTDALPADLPSYDAGGPDPSPGYVVFAAGRYGIALDNAGRVVWYRHFPDGVGLNFMAQPNGRYAARPPSSDRADDGAWVEIDPSGAITRTLGCARGLAPRPHDLIAQPDGSWWILCDEIRTMDLTAIGGEADARVMGTVVQHMAANGSLLFEWSVFDHFAATDVDPGERVAGIVNWTHGNSIDLGVDGGLIVSFRNLGEVTKIDTRTGAVMWRLGGPRNDFDFNGTPVPAFARQHGARLTPGDTLLILDNWGDPAESRAER
jgi:hypothetical protein